MLRQVSASLVWKIKKNVISFFDSINYICVWSLLLLFLDFVISVMLAGEVEAGGWVHLGPEHGVGVVPKMVGMHCFRR